jgi:hypothetical protein
MSLARALGLALVIAHVLRLLRTMSLVLIVILRRTVVTLRLIRILDLNIATGWFALARQHFWRCVAATIPCVTIRPRSLVHTSRRFFLVFPPRFHASVFVISALLNHYHLLV